MHDPDTEHFYTPQFFYRYDYCKNCRKGFKIEFLTSAGEISGARGYDHGENTLEGFSMRDFVINNVFVEENDHKTQVIRIEHKFKMKIENC